MQVIKNHLKSQKPMNDIHSIQKIHQAYEEIRRQTAEVIIGQGHVLEEMFIALLSRGHCLLEGAPGLGKTLLVRTVASALSLEFQRIQCTPDLMPGDITGSEMFLHSAESHGMNFAPGPIFTNILLADEINRTPPRTQSALLEAMQEFQVTVGRKRHPLPAPFFVLATQNPIEQEGTYPLPEAQLDRFMFKIRVDYPSAEEEMNILLRTTGIQEECITPVLDAETLLAAAELVRRVPVAESVVRFACEICRKSRPSSENPGKDEFSSWIRKTVSWGAGPRAGQSLILGAKARAMLAGRFCAEREDVEQLAFPVLRHRIQTSFVAAAEGISSEDVVRSILDECREYDKR